MIFTVVQYLPLLEEEAHGCRIEMSKKSTSSEGGDGMTDQGDSDTDDDSESDIFLEGPFQSNFIQVNSLALLKLSAFRYTFQLQAIQVPPPKV